MFRKVVLLGPARMPQVVEWRGFLAEQVGECLLVTLHDGPVADADAPSVRRLQRGASPTPWEFPGLVRKVRNLIRSAGADLVIAYYLTSYGVIAALAAPGRYVATAAGSDLEPQRWRGPRRLAARLALGRAAGAFAWTEGMAARMRELGAAPERVHVRPRGIDLSVFAPRPAAASPGRTFRIVSTRRLRPIFRHDVAVEAAARLAADGLDVTLDLVGDGTERAPLEALARARGVAERVRFLGNRSRAEIARHLAEADAFLSLSRSDGLSTSVVEALACGAFPVLSDIAPNRELVEHERNGLLVPGDDAGAVAGALRRAAEDSGLRERARMRNAALVSDRFDIRRNTRMFLEAAEGWMRTAGRR